MKNVSYLRALNWSHTSTRDKPGRVALLGRFTIQLRLPSANMDVVWSYLFDYPEPINVALIVNMAFTLLFCILSFGMDNTSMFDQYWCMAPVFIAFYYALSEHSGPLCTRKILVLAAVTIWAVRLFSLFWLKETRPGEESGGTPFLDRRPCFSHRSRC